VPRALRLCRETRGATWGICWGGCGLEGGESDPAGLCTIRHLPSLAATEMAVGRGGGRGAKPLDPGSRAALRLKEGADDGHFGCRTHVEDLVSVVGRDPGRDGLDGREKGSREAVLQAAGEIGTDTAMHVPDLGSHSHRPGGLRPSVGVTRWNREDNRGRDSRQDARACDGRDRSPLVSRLRRRNAWRAPCATADSGRESGSGGTLMSAWV